MKKFIVFIITAIMLMFTASATSMGQVVPKGTWFTLGLEGDELLGREDNEAVSYITSEGDDIINYANEPTYFIVILDDGIFDFKVSSSRYSSIQKEPIIIGYYNTDGELVDREDATIMKLGNEYSSGAFQSEKLGTFIRNKEGYVRLVADKYRGHDFDTKIPTWKTNPPIKVEKKN